MSGPSRRFDPAELHELDGQPLTDAEQAAMLATARDLETFARAESITPSASFEDRVMAAVAAEAPPRPVASGGWLAGLVAMIRDSWRIAFSGGRPMAVRAQALALVMLVVVAFGSVGTLAAVGVAQLLSDGPTQPPTIAPSPAPSLVAPSPSLVPSVSPSVEPSPSMSPSPSPSPSASPEPSETPESTDEGGSGGTARPSPQPTDDDETAEPTETSDTTDDDDDGTPKPTKTPDPDETDEPEETDEPDDTPEPTDD